MAEETERNSRKVRRGYVVSDKMDKTITVELEHRSAHPLYGKVVRTTTKVKAHDEHNDAETEKAIQEERLEALRREKKREEQQDDKTVTLIFKGMTDEEAQIAGESWTGRYSARNIRQMDDKMVQG